MASGWTDRATLSSGPLSSCRSYASPSTLSVIWRIPTAGSKTATRRMPPLRLVQQTMSSSPKAIARAQSKLHGLGYTKIHICGVRPADGNTSSTMGHAGRNAHWRRGHWRHQAHGRGRDLRRLQWIKPTLVRADLGVPSRAHLYEVAPQAPDQRDDVDFSENST